MGLSSATKTTLKKGVAAGLDALTPSDVPGMATNTAGEAADSNGGVVPIYLVKKGETLSKIARSLDMSVDQLARDNNINDPDKINEGQQLKINK